MCPSEAKGIIKNMKMIENGRVMCGIVMPQNPTPREEFAASELINYIKKNHLSIAELNQHHFYINI
mgnify:CR=1 FL=1